MNPADLLALGAAVLIAAAVGSFTCVIIDRLPLALDQPNEYGELWDTRPWPQVLGGRSHCDDCDVMVRPIDNVPVLSWLVLRSRCRRCGARIPAFHPVVEALVPALVVLAVWSVGWGWRVVPVLVLVPVGVAVGVIDLRTMIVPTRLVWPAFGLVVVASVAAAGLEGEWRWLITAAVGLVTMAGPLFLIWFIHPRGMGFGDVRLTVLLGWSVGFYAGDRAIGGVLLAVIALALAAIVGLVMGVVLLGARGRKAQVPFGPSLVIAAFVGIILAGPILEPFGITVPR